MFKNLSTDGLAITGRQGEIIELALSCKFKSMDLNLRDFSEQIESHGLDHARRLIDSAHIGIGQFSLPFAWTEWNDESGFQAEIESLSRVGEHVAAIGCRCCVTTIAAASDELPYHENFERHRGRLGKVAQALAPHDIQLGLEFRAPARLREGRSFEFIHTFDALVKLVESIGHDNVGVVVDTWHCHVGQTDIEEIQSLTAADIAAVYLSDAPAGLNVDEADKIDRLLPGETGTIDCAATLTALAELGYGGPVSVRCSRTGLTSISRDKLVRLAGQRLDQVWKEAGLMPDGTLAVAAGN